MFVHYQLSRRACLQLLLLSTGVPAFSQGRFTTRPGNWVCPMDPDYHASQPGKCPRCGMTLVLHVPERIEYPLEKTVEKISQPYGKHSD